MKHKLCLHGLEVKNQAQLLNLAKRLLPGSTVKVKIKEKYFNDNDMYKYRLTRFTPENTDGIRLYCAWGTLLVSDKLLAIADIIIEFEYHNAEAAEAVDSLLQKLLASKTKFVLEEPDFSQRLDQLRGTAAAKALRGLRLNRLTLELARLLLWLYSVPAPERELTLAEFLSRRFGNWYDKLMELPEKYPDLHNMEQLHRIRIKLKRFRYALQSVPELAPEASLLRSLKYLQDMLGLLHDDYINSLMVERLVASHPKIKELRYEAALFSGWEQAKADAALEALPQQWEAFSSQLTEWKNKNL